MNSKNIFSKLNFAGISAKDLIVQNDVIDQVADLFEKIFHSAGPAQQVYITKAIEGETYAISTAEDSSLSPKEAHNIQITEEQSLRILKYQKMEDAVEKKYELLEYENIKIVTSQLTGVSFADLQVSLFQDLHQDLTIGLDEYAEKLKITKYHSGKFRENDNVKVGNKFAPYIPPKSCEIKTLLGDLLKFYQQKKKINFVDIIEFGILLYAIHPFQNGNKRVVRVVESALLDFYGYTAQRSISLGRAYSGNKTGFNHFIMDSLKHKTTRSFVNFAIRRYLNDGKIVMKGVVLENTMKSLKKLYKISSEKRKKQIQDAFKILTDNSLLKNNEFVLLMREYKHSYSVTQSVLKTLLVHRVVLKHKDGYILKAFAEYDLLNNLIDKICE